MLCAFHSVKYIKQTIPGLWCIRLSAFVFFFFLFFLATNAQEPLKGGSPAGPVTPPPSSTTSDTISDTIAPDSEKPRRQSITDTVSYESERIDYDAEKRILNLVGKAYVKYQNMTLQADTISYLINDNLFIASGQPQLIEGNDTTVGESMIYNIKTRRGKVTYATTHFDEAFFTGRRIVKTRENELYVDHGDYTTCAYVDTPDYYFYGENIKITPNDKIISRPVVLNIGDAPVAVLPYFIFPTERNRRSGFLTPAWGGNPNSGGYLDNIGYYWAPNDYIDFIGRGRISEFREFVLNAASSYALKYWLNGAISARYALRDDIADQQHEWALDYRHLQYLTPDQKTTLQGSGNLISNSRFYERFSEDTTELINQNLSANLSLSRRFESIGASGNLVWNRTQNLQTNDITQSIPSVSFNLFNRPLIPVKTPEPGSSDTTQNRWFNNIYYDINSSGVVQQGIFGNDSLNDFIRPGATASMSISAPQKLFNYITFNPFFNVRGSGFYGYIDTTVRGTTKDSTIRTDTIDNIFSFQPRRDYRVSDTVEIFRDSLGFPDTDYVVTQISPVRETAIRDTSFDKFAGTYSYETGVNLSTNIYGIFPIRIFNFAGLRHTFFPTVSYRYVPEINLNKRFFDIGIPYDFGRKQQQVLALSISNTFDGKVIRKPAKEGEKPIEEKFPQISFCAETSRGDVYC